MNVNIELFDKEPIENLITCLNFEMDKVVYFGYSDVMTTQAIQNTQRALRVKCGDVAVEFIEVRRNALDQIINALSITVAQENSKGNQCFFDLTGGEDLALVAMGIVSKKYGCQMHRFEVSTGKLFLFDVATDMVSNERKTKACGIEECVKHREIKLTLDDMISFQGGVILRDDGQAYHRALDTEAFFESVSAMWSLGVCDNKKWNGLANVLKECGEYTDEDFHVCIPQKKLEQIVSRVSTIAPYPVFYDYLEQLESKKILINLYTENEHVNFTYQCEAVQEVLIDAGRLLELVTYYERKRSGKYSDCRTGVKIDWDGIIRNDKTDVKNEIDVMLLEGYCPVFISCKNGRVDQMALYEVDAVAKRFGGKYVKMEMALGQKMQESHWNRAKEMGILTKIPDENVLK